MADGAKPGGEPPAENGEPRAGAHAASHADGARSLLAAIVESSDDAIVSKDLNGTITSWNRAAERLFGYTAAEAVGRPITMLIPAERLDEEPGILDRVRHGQRIDHYETIRKRKDGTHVDISLTVSPLFDEHGKVVGASKIARDITQAKRDAAHMLFDQQATACLYEIGKRCVSATSTFEESLLAVLDAAIRITGADKGNLQVYDAASDSWTIRAQRGFDAPFLDFFAGVRRDDHCACAAATRAGERVVVEDVAASELFAGRPSRAVLLDAGVRAVQSTPLVDSGGTVLGIVSTHFGSPRRPGERECRWLDVLARQAADYIERKQAEQQREELLCVTQRAREDAEASSRAKDEFLAMLGHELRNPLSAVRNAIAAATLDERNRPRALEIARRQTDQLARIVDDLLDVARITRGRVPLRKQRMKIGDVLQRSVDGARALMSERGHVLTLALPPHPVFLDADAARLEQAVMNLLTNAAKYTDPGGQITLSAERDGEQAVIRVRDNGIGIARDLLPHVFDLFAQGERTLDRAQGGLGIGLTLVRRIAELHGGTVEAKSPGAGGGAEFIVRIPALPAVAGEAAEPQAQRGESVQHSARVLMVEDNLDAAESLMMILELLGHHIRIVNDGASALEAARANLPDVMLVDIGLPGMNGYEVAKAVRAEPALAHIVLVALTGYGRPDDKAAAMAAGFDYHLAKPVDVAALNDLVAKLSPGARELETGDDSKTVH